MTVSSVTSSRSDARSALKAAAARGRAMPGRVERATALSRSIDLSPRAPPCRTNAEGARPALRAAATVPGPSVLIIGGQCHLCQTAGLRGACRLTKSGAKYAIRGRNFTEKAWYVSCCGAHIGPLRAWATDGARRGRPDRRTRGPVRNVTDFPAGKRDPGEAKLGILAHYPHAAPTDDSLSRDSPRRAGIRAGPERSREIEAAGRVRHQGRPERPVERGAVSLGKGDAARPDLRRRLEQPGHRLRARRQVRGSEAGVREGPGAGSEEPDDPAELRSLQRNQ